VSRLGNLTTLAGRYRLVERLGIGGMSVVWRGYDEVLGRQVAIKVLAPTLASEGGFRHRLRAEAQAAARLCHPHITNVYDFGEATGSGGMTVPYVVMELIDGEPMSNRLRGGGSLPWREAVTACAEIASALALAHARGVVHRDVTPNNVMLTDGGAKMVDFGISAVAGENDVGPDGALLGTPAYLAPERMDAGVVSGATDVYALGVVLYRSLAGRLPWRASSTTQMLQAHRLTEPEPLPPVPGLPAEVADLCRRCLAKRPDDRPTAAEVARDLAKVAGIVAYPLGPARTRGGFPAAGPEPDVGSLGTTILPSQPKSNRPRPRPYATGTQRRAGVATGVADTWQRPGPADAGPGPAVRRKLEAVLVGAGLLAVAGLIWAGLSQTPEDAPAEEMAAGQPMAIGQDASQLECTVEYQLRRDTGRTFTAAVGVTNTGRQAVTDWRLEFAFPGDQRVDHGTGAAWHQSGRDVVVRPAKGARLNPDKPVRLAVTGGYTDANPLPVVFTVNGTACQAVVSGVSGGTAAGSGGPAGAAEGSRGPAATKKDRASDDDNSGKDSGAASGNRGPGSGKSGKGKGKDGGDDD
jgi:serine/threonine-protein kinase